MLFILDRDGVINHDSPHYIKSPDEWHAIDGALEAIAAMTAAGHRVVVATNQSGVGRGLFTLATLFDIHAKMSTMIEDAGGLLHGIYYCPHHPDFGCLCRKPQVGLLQAVQHDFPTLFSEALLVGDSVRDMQCAQLMGLPAALVLTGNGQQTRVNYDRLQEVTVFRDLAEVAERWC